jgi:hypothetical protein
MPFIRRPNHWLVMAAFAAAFWITFRVMAAPPAPPAPRLELADDGEVRDPALEVMLARFAGEGRTSGGAQDAR